MVAGQRKHRVLNTPEERSWAGQSRIHYGDGLGAALIADSNPGFQEPLPVGKFIIIPDRPPLVEEPFTQSTDVDPDEVELRIDGQRFQHWTDVSITLSLSAVSTMQWSAPQARTAEFREVFKPFKMQDMELLVGGRHLFTGTLMRPGKKNTTSGGRKISVGGYSRAGHLADCTMPASAFPLQWSKQGLADIARQCARVWSIPVTTIGDMGGTFRRPRIKSKQKVWAFLNNLAQQRKVLMSSTPRGGLLLREPPALGAPVATLREGRAPVTDWALDLNPEQYFSHLTVPRKKARRLTSSAVTIVNERAVDQGILRPLTQWSEETNDPAELPRAAEALAGRMLAGCACWTIDLPTWRDPDGNLWEPGTTINVESAPSVDILRSSDFILSEVQLRRSASTTSASLKLSLPGAYTGEIPEFYPWDE